MKAGAIKKIDAHQFEREAEEHYVEPIWTDRVLFENEWFGSAVHDPCCGFGNIPLLARACGVPANGADIVDRGFPGTVIENFLQSTRKHDNIVMNPPFDVVQEFIEKACGSAKYKVASILQTRRLNAAHWLRALPLTRIWLLTPRPSMLPGYLIADGQNATGGVPEYCWLVFDHAGARLNGPNIGWLHRDKGKL